MKALSARRRSALIGQAEWIGIVAARIQRLPPAWTLLAAAAIFVAWFHAAYADLPDAYYRYRDDGVITLSHARNWVDFGFIGVNPSGERVEATSAPLQMLLYAMAYGASGIGYYAFMDAQTWICTALLGALMAAFFLDRPVFALSAAVLSAWLLTRLHSFLEWHGSGMENAWTHVLVIGTVLVLERARKNGRPGLWAVVIPFIASVSRVDGIYVVAPLLLAYGLHRRVVVGDFRGLPVATGVALLWAGFNAWRWWYFGSLTPNTAVAQGIVPAERLMEWLTVPDLFLQEPMNLARRIFIAHGGLFLLLALPLVAFRERSESSEFTLFLAALCVIQALLAPAFFGGARLDVTRTTTWAAPCVALALMSAARGTRPGWRHAAMFLPILLVFLPIRNQTVSAPYPVCCDARLFDSGRDTFLAMAESEGVRRATFANPDLGAFSGIKRLNVLDLGFLGSPVMARLRGDPMAATFFFELAAPDLVESHQIWSCLNVLILRDPRLQVRYRPMPWSPSPYRCRDGREAVAGVWLRSDIARGSPSAERALLESLQSSPSVDRVRSELERCEAQHHPQRQPLACAYVSRAAYRLLPEFRAAGERDRLLAVFERSRTRAWDHFLLNGDRDGKAWEPMIAWLRTLRASSSQARSS